MKPVKFIQPWESIEATICLNISLRPVLEVTRLNT